MDMWAESRCRTAHGVARAGSRLLRWRKGPWDMMYGLECVERHLKVTIPINHDLTERAPKSSSPRYGGYAETWR